jgi:hypothetical protein
LFTKSELLKEEHEIPDFFNVLNDEEFDEGYMEITEEDMIQREIDQKEFQKYISTMIS